MSGDTTKQNPIKLLTRVPVDTETGWRNSGASIPIGTPVYNITTRELKIGMNLPFHETLNHAHPDQYSGLGHEHMGGFNEKWFMTMPRLVHRVALTLYPELVPLDGTYVTGEKAGALSSIYSGITLINPIITNGDMSKVVVTASSVKNNFYAWNIFNDFLTINNAHWTIDQWITEEGTTSCTLTIQFVEDAGYTFSGYEITSRLGDMGTPYIQTPSPKDWVVEGSIDGTTWTEIETFSNQEIWQPGETRAFDNPSEVNVKYIRFTFSAWHPGADGTLSPGLKRLYLLGKRPDGFAMPTITAPDGFVYAVPYKDLGIGMKHEEIGDIVYMSSDVKVTPINRVPVDGRVLKKSLEPDLFSVIDYKYDTFNLLAGVTVSTPEPHSVSLVNGTIQWNSTANDNEAVIEYFDISGITDKVSMYTIYPKPDGLKPTHWLFEAYDGTTWHTLHDRSFDPATETYGLFKLQVIAEDYTVQKYRLSVISWEGVGTVGLKDIKLYTHPVGYYYIPRMTYNPTDAIIPYIVTRVRTEDVNSSIVLRLQNSLAAAMDLISNLESRLTTLEIAHANNP